MYLDKNHNYSEFHSCGFKFNVSDNEQMFQKGCFLANLPNIGGVALKEAW